MDNKKTLGERIGAIIDEFNDAIDNALMDLADHTGIEPEYICMGVVIAFAVFAIGFTYGYNKSNEHFLELVNQHQIEHEMPAVDSRIFIVD